MKQRVVLMSLFLFFVFGSLLAYNLYKTQLRDLFLLRYQPPAVTVSASTSQSETWQPSLSAVGSTVAVQGVNITTQAGGKIIKILFEDGQTVQKEDLIVVLEDSLQKAQLENTKAARDLAAIAIKRYTPLLLKGAISPFQMDKLRAELKEAQAQVGEAQAKLDYMHIRAPFTGRLGIRQIDLGQYVSPGDNIVRLDTVGNIFVDFTLPEKNLDQVTVGQKISLETDAIPNQKFNGKIIAISPQIDPTTRSISLRANIPNDNNAIPPGIFANVSIFLKESQQVITVPKTAVSYSLYGDTVYVIQDESKNKKNKKDIKEGIYTVKRVTVKTGEEQGSKIAIETGIQAKQKVITSGQLKLESGSRVKIKQDDLEPPETMPLQ